MAEHLIVALLVLLIGAVIGVYMQFNSFMAKVNKLVAALQEALNTHLQDSCKHQPATDFVRKDVCDANRTAITDAVRALSRQQEIMSNKMDLILERLAK